MYGMGTARPFSENINRSRSANVGVHCPFSGSTLKSTISPLSELISLTPIRSFPPGPPCSRRKCAALNVQVRILRTADPDRHGERKNWHPPVPAQINIPLDTQVRPVQIGDRSLHLIGIDAFVFSQCRKRQTKQQHGNQNQCRNKHVRICTVCKHVQVPQSSGIICPSSVFQSYPRPFSLVNTASFNNTIYITAGLSCK